MKTVTFDETTHAIVPIVADELMLNAGEYFSENALLVWDLMLDAAPPYQSVEVNDMGWVPVSKRLPELHTAVALLNINTWMNTGGDFEINWCGCGWLCEFGNQYWNIIGERGGRTMDSVTHWMPLPAAPKGEE
jgi:hypothetical protein